MPDPIQQSQLQATGHEGCPWCGITDHEALYEGGYLIGYRWDCGSYRKHGITLTDSHRVVFGKVYDQRIRPACRLISSLRAELDDARTFVLQARGEYDRAMASRAELAEALAVEIATADLYASAEQASRDALRRYREESA